MKEEYEKLIQKATALEVALFIANYGGTVEGAKLGSELLERLGQE